MPDPTRQTISATEIGGLLGVSPYVTKWMLYQRFANGMDIDPAEDSRMSWGKKLQPLVLEQCAEDMKFEVQPNATDDYHRRGLLGCTRDATIICPDRGPGALETKCVFDYRTWMADWQGGKSPPRMHEIQLQQQMLVGEGSGAPYAWGVIAAWVAGEVHYFEREPIRDLWEKLNDEALAFFKSVEAKREPDPFGLTIEVPLLNKVYPTVTGNVLDLTSAINAHELAEKVALFKFHKAEENGHGRAAEALRAQLIALAKGAEEVLLPERIKVKCSTSKNGAKRLTVYVPDEVSTPTAKPTIAIEEILYGG